MNIKILHRLLLIFIVAFVANLLWENAHSYLYVLYKGNLITEPILLKASVFDAVFITTALFAFVLKPEWKRYIWISVLVALVFAIKLELYALATDRWEYNNFMPLLPLFGVGLSPVIQLPLLTYATYFFVLRKRNA